jgi:hypothetical protein
VLQKEVSTLTERCRATGLTMVRGEAPSGTLVTAISLLANDRRRKATRPRWLSEDSSCLRSFEL